jgi:hypothetical protein
MKFASSTQQYQYLGTPDQAPADCVGLRWRGLPELKTSHVDAAAPDDQEAGASMGCGTTGP